MGNGRQTLLDRLRKTFRIDYDDDCLDKWEGIELVTKSLDQQTESRIGMLLVNALLVFCITAGGMGIVLSAIDSDYQTLDRRTCNSCGITLCGIFVLP